MAHFHSNALIGASGGQAGGGGPYEIERSLRFNSADSAYLSRTPSSAGNRKTWTWSGWVKLGKLASTANVHGHLMRVNTGPETAIRFKKDGQKDCIQFFTFSGSLTSDIQTNAVFRDHSAWYHIVVACDTTQSTSSNRVKIYVNGVLQTLSTSTYPSQNYDTGFNTANAHAIGATASGSEFFDGYLTEIHLVDGQQLAASDFGEYDDNNNWIPKGYSGSYGTNGFYLKFADNSSSSALGTDSSGNTNTFSVNNISVASGSGNDSLIDTPTNYTPASGNAGGNYCVLNPLASDTTLLNGNLESDGGSGWKFGIGTIAFPKSGKWYFEVEATAYSGNFGIAKLLSSSQNNATIRDSAESTAVWYAFDGKVWSRYSGQGSTTSVQTGLATFNNGDIVGFGVNVDDEEVKFYVNGSLQYTYSLPTQIAADLTAGKLFPIVDTVSGANAICNFGQRPFAYTPPTAHVSLCTQNLPDPTIAKGSTVFDTKLYTGTGSNFTVTYDFSPDFAWIKGRSYTSNGQLSDTVRSSAGNKRFELPTGNAEDAGGPTFVSTGLSLGTNAAINTNNQTYVSWAWDAGSSTVSNSNGSITSNVRANASAGFSIVSWSGNSQNATVGHGLGAVPKMIIHKRRNGAASFITYHEAIGNTNAMQFNASDALINASYFDNKSPTSTIFNVSDFDETNRTGSNYIAYCFAPIEGYSAFGSYEGNGSSDGPFVYTGFRPAFVLYKNVDAAAGWQVYDSSRDTSNVCEARLQSNSTASEDTQAAIDILSNGFKQYATHTRSNANNNTYLYAAFAEHPFKTARAR